MTLGTKINVLQTENHLTPEQFASRLNVSKQAVSNWENNRNLPGLEILLLIARSFHISLDELILRGNKVNKFIQDGTETRRARFNRVTTMMVLFYYF